MRLQHILSFMALITFLLSGCVDEIDFEVPREYQNSTVIVGKLVKGDKPSVEVLIQKIFDFSFQEKKYLIAKSMHIVDQEGNKVEVPKLGLGHYKLDLSLHPEFEVEIGKAYSLELELLDGQTFKSKFEIIQPVPKISKVEVDLVLEEFYNYENQKIVSTRVEYYLSTPLYSENNQKPVNIKWDIKRTHKQTDKTGKACYITNNPKFDFLEYIESELVAFEELDNYKILVQGISPLMSEGQYISIIQESISDDGLKFFEQMKELSNNSGTFYEPPVGKIITNFETTSDIEGSVFGYFYVTNHDTMRTYVGPELIGNISNFCSFFQTAPGVCDQCCDCENAENSTTSKPSFWIP